MDRDEILAMSRQENQKQDEMERDTLVRAGRVACAVGGLVCMAVIILEAIFSDHVNMSTWAVLLSITGTMLLMKYMRQKKVHELVFAVLQLALAAAFFVMHVIGLMG